MVRKIHIFDTTLRDGEQAPGCSLNTGEKLEIAKQLERLGVDMIEAGFASSSPGDFDAVQKIAQTVKNTYVCSLARVKKEDIDASLEAVKPARHKGIHIFIATSPIHMEKKLRMSPDEVFANSVELVKYAKKSCDNITFSCEDATRSELPFLCRIIEGVIDAGATSIDIPDTVGYTVPSEFAQIITHLKNHIPNISKARLAVHCHNDLGMATANSITAIMNGVDEVHCTINGLGERAGNASLEEVVMILKTRKDILGCETTINTKEIYRTSRLVSNLTGMIVQANKAIVGANAFAHEAGIHQAGVMRARETYEIMDPKEIGLSDNKMVLGKHSGRNAFVGKLKELGYDLQEADIETAFQSFKALADKKKDVSDRDIESLVSDEIYVTEETIKLEEAQITSGTKSKPFAKIAILENGVRKESEGTGDGPVDAVYKVIDSLIGRKIQLVDYVIQAISGGTDALGEVTVRINDEGRIFSGHGSDTDIIIASAKAYINAINKLGRRP